MRNIKNKMILIVLMFFTFLSTSFAYEEMNLNPYQQQTYTNMLTSNAQTFNQISLQKENTIQPPVLYNKNQYVNRYSENIFVNPPIDYNPKINMVKRHQRLTNPNHTYGQVYNDGSEDSYFLENAYISLSYINATAANEDGISSEIEDDNLPGNWSEYQNSFGKATGFSVSVGSDVAKNMRAELSYISLSGFEYSDYASQYRCNDLGDCEEEQFPKLEGGEIETNAFMLNFYYSLKNLTGNFLDGMIAPYVGVGFGFGKNKISDYVLYDGFGYLYDINGTIVRDYNDLIDSVTGAYICNPTTNLCGVEEFDGEIKYKGQTTQTFAWMYEIGLTVDFQNDFLLDVFYRYSNYGEIKTSGQTTAIYYTDNLYSGLDPINCQAQGGAIINAADDGTGGLCSIPGADSEGAYTDATEKGVVETQEIGIKLRYVF